MTHKVAIYQRDVFPSSPFAKNLYRTVEEMSARGWLVDVLLIDDTFWRADCSGRLFSFAQRYSKFLPAHYLAILSIAVYLWREKPDVLIAKGPVIGVSAALAKAFGLSKTKIYVSLHIPLSVHEKSSMYRSQRFIPLLLKIVSPLVERFVGVSKGVSDDFIKSTKINPSKFSVINHASLDEQSFAESEIFKILEIRENLPKKSKNLKLLAVGRLAPEKGFDVLIDSIKYISPQYELKCKIVGDGPCKSELHELVELGGLSEVIEFTGRVSNVTELYDWADVFILPSFYEGLPNVVLEALSRGCPVVATDCVGGTSELLAGGKFGTLVKPGDADDLARGIIEELRSERCPRDLIDRATFFSIKNTVDRWVAIFNRPLK